MTIEFANQKGRAGKTSLSLNVARYLALQAKRTFLVEADRQRSSATWAEGRGDTVPPFADVKRATDYDHVGIDGPRDAEAITRNVIVVSEIVVLPIEPSAFFTNETKTTIAQLEEC